MDYKDIKKLIDDMGNSNLDSLEIEFPEGIKISMTKNTGKEVVITSANPSVIEGSAPMTAPAVREDRGTALVNVKGEEEENYKIDLTIARGLDYYTGTVYETFLNDYREIGSICSGGRYENLAEYYTNKRLPGVGVSIGLTRLFYKLNELNLINVTKKSISDIIIIPMMDNLEEPIKLATELRNLGVNTEIYSNNKKLKAKMKYADKLQIPYVIVIGEDEINSNKIKLKNMETGEEEEIELNAEEIAKKLKK